MKSRMPPRRQENEDEAEGCRIKSNHTPTSQAVETATTEDTKTWWLEENNRSLPYPVASHGDTKRGESQPINAWRRNIMSDAGRSYCKRHRTWSCAHQDMRTYHDTRDLYDLFDNSVLWETLTEEDRLFNTEGNVQPSLRLRNLKCYRQKHRLCEFHWFQKTEWQCKCWNVFSKWICMS